MVLVFFLFSILGVHFCHKQVCFTILQGFASDKSPINVFGVILKGNDVARRIKLRHFRGNEELPLIIEDNSFSNFFQAPRTLKRPVSVQSVSTIIVHLQLNHNQHKHYLNTIFVCCRPRNSLFCNIYIYILYIYFLFTYKYIKYYEYNIEIVYKTNISELIKFYQFPMVSDTPKVSVTPLIQSVHIKLFSDMFRLAFSHGKGINYFAIRIVILIHFCGRNTVHG